MDRTIQRILAEWRAAEVTLKADPDNVDLQELVATLRDEHSAAVEAHWPEVMGTPPDAAPQGRRLPAAPPTIPRWRHAPRPTPPDGESGVSVSQGSASTVQRPF